MLTLSKTKQLIFSILFPIVVLLFIKLSYKNNCYFLIVPIIMSFFIAYSLFQKRMREKICFKNCYFKEDTFIAKIITSPYLTIVVYIVISLIYTISIIYSIVSFTWYLYLLLAFFIAFVFVLYHKLLSYFSKVINQEHLEIFTKELSIKISSFVLLFIFMLSFIYSYEPNYLSNSLEESLQLATNSLSSKCIYLDYILRLKVELDTYFWFFAKQSSQILQYQEIKKTLVWIVFIVVNAISILGLSRFIVQIISLSSKIEDTKENKTDE